MNKVAVRGVTKSPNFFPGGINERARFSGSESVLQVEAVSSWILIDLVTSLLVPSFKWLKDPPWCPAGLLLY